MEGPRVNVIRGSYVGGFEGGRLGRVLSLTATQLLRGVPEGQVWVMAVFEEVEIRLSTCSKTREVEGIGRA